MNQLRAERNDCGATAVEYAIMVTMIAVVIAGAVMLFGLQVADLFMPVLDTF